MGLMKWTVNVLNKVLKVVSSDNPLPPEDEAKIKEEVKAATDSLIKAVDSYNSASKEAQDILKKDYEETIDIANTVETAVKEKLGEVKTETETIVETVKEEVKEVVEEVKSTVEVAVEDLKPQTEVLTDTAQSVIDKIKGLAESDELKEALLNKIPQYSAFQTILNSELGDNIHGVLTAKLQERLLNGVSMDSLIGNISILDGVLKSPQEKIIDVYTSVFDKFSLFILQEREKIAKITDSSVLKLAYLEYLNAELKNSSIETGTELIDPRPAADKILTEWEDIIKLK